MIKIKKEVVLVTPKDIRPSSPDFEVIGTFNPAAQRLPDGNIVLYVRVIEKLKKTEDSNYCYSPRFVGKDKFKIKIDKFHKRLIKNFSDLDFIFKDGTKRLCFISHLRRIILNKTGFKVLSIDKKPSFYGVSWDGELGIEDPRITKINDLYVMTYVSLTKDDNISTSYAISNDCINWYRRGVIFGEQDKDVVIFPEIINNRYVAFDRPEGSFQFSLPHIWIAYSKDLEYWGDNDSVIISKKGDWDYGRKGAGPPPIKTKEGWLLLYHAVVDSNKFKRENNLEYGIILEEFLSYFVGAALFDLKNPKKIIAKSNSPIISPSKYGKMLLENKIVVFPTGIVMDNDNLLIFSGEGDRITTVKKISLQEILKALKPIKN